MVSCRRNFLTVTGKQELCSPADAWHISICWVADEAHMVELIRQGGVPAVVLCQLGDEARRVVLHVLAHACTGQRSDGQRVDGEYRT